MSNGRSKVLRGPLPTLWLVGLLLLVGCASITVNSRPYLGGPTYAPTTPASVQILKSEPTQPKVRLGEVMLSVSGQPSREDIERKLKEAAARLGANATFIVYDHSSVFPVVYPDWYWGGPTGVNEYVRRDIVAVAVRYAGG